MMHRKAYLLNPGASFPFVSPLAVHRGSKMEVSAAPRAPPPAGRRSPSVNQGPRDGLGLHLIVLTSIFPFDLGRTHPPGFVPRSLLNHLKGTTS